jgi:glycosyltransferase involved in cell wall biosynthesis
VGETIQDWRVKLPRNEQPRVVYDTEAIASVRTWLTEQLARSESVDVTDLAGSVPRELVKRELAAAERADALVLVNQVDDRLAREVIERPTSVLGLCFEAKPTPADFGERKGLLFCGAVHEVGAPNYDSLVWLCNKILPLLRAAIPDLRVRVIGYWKHDVPVPESLEQPEVELIGAVDELEPYFAQARVFIAPTRVAAGVPHKVQQSMALGLPAVVTPILAAQLADLSGRGEVAFRAADFTADAFAKAIVHAYTHRSAWERVRKAGLAAIRAHSSPAAFAHVVDQIAGVPAR